MVSAADVIIEVLDARDPLGSRCLDVERFVRRSGADKKIILLLNKIGELSAFTCGACIAVAASPWSSGCQPPRKWFYRGVSSDLFSSWRTYYCMGHAVNVWVRRSMPARFQLTSGKL